jgi:hypothetical protein
LGKPFIYETSHDNKFLFLLSAVTIVIVLEILSIIGLDIPMPYAPFIFALFVIGIGHRFAKWRKSINLNLAASIY